MMIRCTFTVRVWELIGRYFGPDYSWHGEHIIQAFENWFSGGRELRTIPFYVCSFIWLARNSYIFRHIITTPLQIVNKVRIVWK